MLEASIVLLGVTVQIWLIISFFIMVLVTGLHFVTDAGPKMVILGLWIMILLTIVAGLTTGVPPLYR